MSTPPEIHRNNPGCIPKTLRASIVLFALVILLAAGCSRNKVRVVSAVYGWGKNFADVTTRVDELLAHPSGFEAHPDALKVDPVPGWNKELLITYDVNGQRHVFATAEGGRVNARLLLEAAR
jgi:hypothetical protein